MVLCDACNDARHLRCVEPALISVPAGHWVCPRCTAQCIRLADIEATAQAAAKTTRTRAGRKPVVPSKTQAEEDTAARALHGRLVKKQFFTRAATGKRTSQWFWGRLHFRGPTFRPNYFQVTYSDGDYVINSMPRLLQQGMVLQ
ncbi:MAG: hypothetical protein J3K34DRAFT_381471, partial [Monoraphidium minutum]